MSYESTAEPIKVGYLMDFRLPEFYPQEMRDDFGQPFELVFDEGRQQGVIDRPVQIVQREVEGLPKGSVKAVIDAYADLVDEGCLVVFGPHISENAVPRPSGPVAYTTSAGRHPVRVSGAASAMSPTAVALM